MALTNQQIVGDLGEIIFQACFGGIMSDNQFDSTKDLMLDDKTVEIKTQCRYKNISAFTVNKAHSTNLRKCLSVDRLIFIEYDTTNEIKIFECVDRDYFTVKTASGKVMACFPIDKMILLKTINNSKLANLFRCYSSSKAV